jgi:hypothetical protein
VVVVALAQLVLIGIDRLSQGHNFPTGGLALVPVLLLGRCFSHGWRGVILVGRHRDNALRIVRNDAIQ